MNISSSHSGGNMTLFSSILSQNIVVGVPELGALCLPPLHYWSNAIPLNQVASCKLQLATKPNRYLDTDSRTETIVKKL